jgi:hypothetical protein
MLRDATAYKAPPNKPLHLTAARSLARRPSRLARRGLRPLRSRQTGARGQVSGNGVRPTARQFSRRHAFYETPHTCTFCVAATAAANEAA